MQTNKKSFKHQSNLTSAGSNHHAILWFSSRTTLISPCGETPNKHDPAMQLNIDIIKGIHNIQIEQKIKHQSKEQSAFVGKKEQSLNSDTKPCQNLNVNTSS
jgi:hypothetical protein